MSAGAAPAPTKRAATTSKQTNAKPKLRRAAVRAEPSTMMRTPGWPTPAGRLGNLPGTLARIPRLGIPASGPVPRAATSAVPALLDLEPEQGHRHGARRLHPDVVDGPAVLLLAA